MPIKGLKLHGRRLRLAIVGASAFVALIASISSIYEIQLLPPSIQKRDLQLGVAATNAIVDYRSEGDGASIADLVSYNDLEAMTERTEPLARVMTSEALLDRIGKQLGVDPSQISATTQVTQSAPRSLIEPDNERRAAGILGGQASYRIEAQAEPNLPVLGIYAEAPTPAEATSLADTAVGAVNGYLRDQGRKEGTPATAVVHLTQLGAARGGPVDATAPWKIAALTFVGRLRGLLWSGRADRRGSARLEKGVEADRRGSGRGRGRVHPSAQRAAARNDPDRDRPRRDDWPHTTRLLPWMIAGFIAMLWLVPFNGVLLNASLPIDLNLDRLVLPVIVLTWVVALAAGGPGAPRWRFTPIHAALAAFALVAGLSVVLNAGALDRTLVLDLSVKKLTLLLAYLSFFVVVASAVRAGRGTSLPQVHARARGDLRDLRDLGIPHGIQHLLRPHDASAARLLPSARSTPRLSTSSDGASRRPDRARTRGGGDPLDGLPDRDRRDHAREALARPDPLRTRGLHPRPGDALDLPQERPARPGDRRPRARLLPPAPGAQARAPGGRW